MKTTLAVMLLVSIGAARSGTITLALDQSDCECVPYYQCNMEGTMNDDGEGIIDIRNYNPTSTRRQCDHYLAVCCLNAEFIGPSEPMDGQDGSGMGPGGHGNDQDNDRETKRPTGGYGPGEDNKTQPPSNEIPIKVPETQLPSDETPINPPTNETPIKIPEIQLPTDETPINPPTNENPIKIPEIQLPTDETPINPPTNENPIKLPETQLPTDETLIRPPTNENPIKLPETQLPTDETLIRPPTNENPIKLPETQLPSDETSIRPPTGENPIKLPETPSSETPMNPTEPIEIPTKKPSGGHGRPHHKKPHVGRGCGHRNANGIGFRIVGNFNNEANFAEFPWMVAILKNKVYQCGGSLIHQRVVLTAAHCVFGKMASELTIRAGEWDTQTVNEPLPHQDRDVSVVIKHPKYNFKNLHNDYALLILEKPVDIADNVETVCLPKKGDNFDHSKCFASGWGKNEFGDKGKYQVILKAVELPVVPHDKCQSSLRQTRLGKYFKLDQSLMCAGGVADIDTCTGDGGSPLVCPLPNDPTRYAQAGIVAWGIGCGKDGVPGVYGDVTLAREWIDEQLASFNIDSSSYTPEDKLSGGYAAEGLVARGSTGYRA